MTARADKTEKRSAGAGLRAAMMSAAVAVLFAHGAFAKTSVPLPRPRPVDAPKAEPREEEASPDVSKETAKPTEDAKAPELSPCRLALTEQIAIAPSIPPIKGPGACGGIDLVRLEAVILPGDKRVSVKPAAILRCTMATAIADWIRTDMAPLAASLNTQISELDNFDSFECRGRNRIVGAKLSEHGLANALDVRSLNLANGTKLSLTDRNLSRETREKVHASVCARFMTVLGPGSDWYHEDHIHLDLAERRNNFKLCNWGIYDPLPAIAPLMPAERPDEAPPRLTAEEKTAQDKAAQDKTDGPAPNAEEDEGEAARLASEKSADKSAAKKKRK